MQFPLYLILFISLLCIFVSGAKFKIASTSTCSNTSSAGFCTKWQQNGTVQQELAACFSKQMVLLTKLQGYKYMNQININDQILSYDHESNMEIYTKVKGWLHKDDHTYVKFKKVNFGKNQSVIVSEKHNIAVEKENAQYQFKFAGKFDQKSKLYLTNNQISSIQNVYLQGMYAIRTQNSKYFVFTSKNQSNVKILAHDYANLKNPQAYQSIANFIIDTYQFLFSTEQIQKIHPAAEWMMKTFKFLVQ